MTADDAGLCVGDLIRSTLLERPTYIRSRAALAAWIGQGEALGFISQHEAVLVVEVQPAGDLLLVSFFAEGQVYKTLVYKSQLHHIQIIEREELRV